MRLMPQVGFVLLFAVAGLMMIGMSNNARPSGLDMARAYIEVMETGDLASADKLFLDGDRSVILENASNEGSWENYRDHHLAPEIEHADGFRFTLKEESESRFGSTIIVHQVGSFSVKLGDETREFRVAVSYVIVRDRGENRIAHLHWTSRPAPAKKAEPKAGDGHEGHDH